VLRRQYLRVEKEIKLDGPINLDSLEQPIVIMPVTEWNRITAKAMRFAFAISSEIHGINIHAEEDECHHLLSSWKELVEAPATRAGLPPPQLEVVASSYRFILHPLLQ